MSAVVYKITHVASGKSYVGSTCQLLRRWSLHRKALRVGKHHSRHLQSAWNKYGEDAFIFEVIEIVDDVGNLIVREQAWINDLKAWRDGYNVSPTAGSPRGVKHTAETRAKVSAAGTGRTLSPGHVALISARAKVASLVHFHSPEARARAGAKNRGKVKPESARRTLSRIRTGMKFPPEWRAAISACAVGRKHGPMPLETRAKLSVAATGKSPTAETRVKLVSAAKLRGAPKLTREAIDRGAAKRKGAKRTSEQKERMRIGRASSPNQQRGKHSPERIAARVSARARNKALMQLKMVAD